MKNIQKSNIVLFSLRFVYMCYIIQNMKRTLKQAAIAGMACCMLLTGNTMHAYADVLYDNYQVGTSPAGKAIDYGRSKLCDNIVEATQLMEELLQSCYDETTKEIEKQIDENGYDYELTMQTLSEKGNPYAEADMKKLVAASCTVTSMSKYQVSEIPYLTVHLSDRYITKYQPYKYTAYKKDGNGYMPDGVAYLAAPGYIYTYEKKSDGTYKRTGKKYINPEKIKVKYADVTLKVSEPKEIFSSLGINQTDAMEDYNQRMAKIQDDSGSSLEDLCQTIFVKTRSTIEPVSQECDSSMQDAINKAEGNRQVVLATAASLLGKVPYLWGGKSTKAGYDDTWWSIGKDGKQKGLDCSGYVQWVFRTAGYPEDVWKPIGSTAAILKNADKITESELKPGDLGLLHDGSKGTNHVGIYIGDGYFIHCSSSAGTVTISKPNFTVFMRVRGIDEGTIVPTEVKCGGDDQYTEDDVTLLAKLIAHEVRGEGMNSWIAVGEVVMNRVHSKQFPNTLHDVIYQESKSGVKQFSYNEGIASMEPSADITRVARGVLDGSLHVLNNSRVLYFRNPGSLDNNDDWGPFKFFKRIGPVVYYLGKDW